MTFEVVFEDTDIGRLSEAEIDSFSFIGSVFETYTACRLIVKDYARQTFNKIKTGTRTKVRFSDGDNTYENPMSVVSFNKVPGPQLGDYLEITLTPTWYFEDKVETKAYSGSVGEIIRKICGEVFQMDDISITSTSDTPRYRYQTAERTQKFMKRLTKYAFIDGRPVYLYMDPKGRLNLKGVADMLSAESGPRYLVTPTVADQMKQNSEYGDTLKEINMFSYTFSGNGGRTSSEINSIYSTDLFRAPGETVASITSPNTENNNAQSLYATPPRTDFYGWNLTPDDARAISIRKNFEETYGTYILDATFKGMPVNELELGTTVVVLLPYPPTEKSSRGKEVNCSEGKYLVTAVKYVYEKGMSKTLATLVQVAY